MSEYIITTDSDSYTTEARTADEAAARYTGRKGKGGPSTLAGLVDHIEEMGGELTVTEDGAVIARVPKWVSDQLADQIVEQDAALTCCVCGADIRESDDYECIATDHGPDHRCGGCEYTGDEEWPCDD